MQQNRYLPAINKEMNPEEIINQQILKPKRAKFVNHFVEIVEGNETSFEKCEPWTKYYEVWYYSPFDFRYIFLAKNNLVVNILDEGDVEKISQITYVDHEPVTEVFSDPQ